MPPSGGNGPEPAGSRAAAGAAPLPEILRGDLAAAPAETLHLALALVRDRDAAGLQHLVGAHDPAAGAQRDRDRVAGPAVDREAAVEGQLGVEDVVADREDPDLLQLTAEGVDERLEQVVR